MRIANYIKRVRENLISKVGRKHITQSERDMKTYSKINGNWMIRNTEDVFRTYMRDKLDELYKEGKVHTCYSASGVPYEVITVSDYREVTERSRE